MIVHLPFLLLAIALLWFPRQWMRQGLSFRNRRRRRSEGAIRRSEEPWRTTEPGDPAVKSGVEFAKLRNYVDLLRGAAGGIAVFGGFDIVPSLAVAPSAPALVGKEVAALKIAILLVGVLIQTVRYERHRLLFFAPIFFLFGLSLGLCGPKPALFAFATIWTVNPVLRNPQGFLSAYAVLIALFGFFFRGLSSMQPIVAFVLCFLPVLLSLLAQRPLVLFSRKATRTATAPT